MNFIYIIIWMIAVYIILIMPNEIRISELEKYIKQQKEKEEQDSLKHKKAMEEKKLTPEEAVEKAKSYLTQDNGIYDANIYYIPIKSIYE